uniref:Uncharacterized protein n=1 Tax=Glossina pallidipes TaxID=7398 RepID=A0A1B0A869_GLOPL
MNKKFLNKRCLKAGDLNPVRKGSVEHNVIFVFAGVIVRENRVLTTGFMVNLLQILNNVMSDDSKALLEERVVAGQPSLDVEAEKSQVVHFEVPEYENDGKVPFTNHVAMIRLLHKLIFTAQTVSMMPINKKKFDDEVFKSSELDFMFEEPHELVGIVGTNENCYNQDFLNEPRQAGSLGAMPDEWYNKFEEEDQEEEELLRKYHDLNDQDSVETQFRKICLPVDDIGIVSKNIIIIKYTLTRYHLQSTMFPDK